MVNKSSFVLSDEATVMITNRITGETVFEGEVSTIDIQIIPLERPEHVEITFRNGSKLIHPKSIEGTLRGKSSENILIIVEDELD